MVAGWNDGVGQRRSGSRANAPAVAAGRGRRPAGGTRKRRGGGIMSVLAQLEAWLIEPLPEQVAPTPAPLVSVVGLEPGCGATTVARALAARRSVRVTDGVIDPAAAATIVVAPPHAEPALAELFAGSLPTGGRPLIVVNRSREDDRWSGRAAAFVPESQIGARVAALGWEPRGAMGRAIARLAERVRSQSGQALVLMLGAMAAIVMGA